MHKVDYFLSFPPTLIAENVSRTSIMKEKIVFLLLLLLLLTVLHAFHEYTKQQ
jgi:hypothetical protein